MDKAEGAWRTAIADQVRRNCTPSHEAYSRGGDSLIYAVADWIESPPQWSLFENPYCERDESMRAADSLRAAQERVIDYARDVMQHSPAMGAPALVRELYRHFDLMIKGDE